MFLSHDFTTENTKLVCGYQFGLKEQSKKNIDVYDV